MDRREKIRGLPSSPGVYIMKDAGGAVLYVGKAANVRKRVASYFYPHRRLYGRLESMVGQVDRVECVPTATEAEALVYENSLIKQLAPKYNVMLRDDKSYPRLKLTVNEKYPRLLVTRRKAPDGALYYGPYTSAALLREAVIALRQIFPLRSCGKMAKRPCLNYHLRQCLAPCAGKVSDEAYAEMVAELRLFLEKGRPGLLKSLADRMLEASKGERFEEAAKMKARIEALSSMKERSVRYIPADETEELRAMLGLAGPIDVIEAFDVSNISGAEAVGSMVYFSKGRPRKSEYRKFRIRTVEGADDYAMMREIVRRRYERSLAEKKRLPDLIVIDGGKGHLAAALGELEALGIPAVPAIGIAKPARLQESPARSGGPARLQESPTRSGGQFEHIYMKDSKEPLILPRDSKALHLLERIRDEAHRFAITYHKGLRSKKIGFSELDEVRLIGPKRKKALIERFGSVDGMKAATLEELVKTDGMDERSAKNLFDHFRK